MKRSKLLALLLALVMLASLLAACGGTPSSAPAEESTAPPAAEESTGGDGGEEAPADGLSGTLTVWSWDVALAYLKDVSARFNEIHPNVEFVFEEMGTDQIYDKLTVSLATGSGLPDVVSIEGEQFARFAANFPDAFTDYTDDINPDDFLQVKLAEATVNGRLLGYPWDAAPVGLWYRSDVFEEAGVDPASLATWDDLIEAGLTIKEKTGYQMLPMATSRNDIIYRIILMQLNSWYFDEEGNTQVDSPESIKAMELVKKIYDAGITQDHMDWDEYVSTITQDKVACFAEGVWMGGSIKDDAPEAEGIWRAMDLPMVDATSTGAATNGGSLVAVPSTTESPEAAKAFVQYAMTDVDEQIHGYNTFGLYPSYIPAYADASFNEGDSFYGGQNINEVFAEIGQKIPFVNFTANFAEATDSSKNTVAQVLLEGRDVTEALEALQGELSAKFGQ